MKVAIVRLNEIEIGNRTREEFGDLNQLALSLRESGMIQGLAVHYRPENEKPYYLLAGERRFRACEIAEMTEVPVRIYERKLSALELDSIELAENLYRKDFTYPEDCEIKRRIYDLEIKIYGRRISKDPTAPGTTQKDVAEKLGKSSSQFHDDVELAKAIEVIPELGKCRNKSEAMKLYKALKENVVRDELARRAEAEVVKSPAGIKHKALCDQYIVGNFFDLVGKIPSGSINLVELDPPYAIDLKKLKKKESEDIKLARNYNEIGIKDYMPFMTSVLEECYRIMADHSWLVMWFGPDPWFEPLYKLAIMSGFEGHRLPGLWMKPSGQTMQPAYNLANCTEMFFYLRKGKPALIQQGRSNVFEYKPVPASKKTHPTERPIELISDILATFCSAGARIAVPFVGSGATLLSAANMKMTAFGYDLTQEYKDSYILKVHQSEPPDYTSY